MEENVIYDVARFFREKKPWLVLTGAGISTESGIPDFRTPSSGLWVRYDPMEVLSRDVLFSKPDVFYQVGFRILMSFRDAQPNEAHFILAEWEKRGWVVGIVTQNIDGLHTKAGSKKVMEIHGHLRSGSCLSCGQSVPIEVLVEKAENDEIPPKCGCGGVLRPDVVLFGDVLPSCFEEAMFLARQYPLLVIGSSLQVSPANFLPTYTPHLMIINIGETPFDGKAQWVLRDKASVVLRRLHEAIEK
ncbi:MAG: NAD-dependent deacetylase [Atribacterota bacterium]|nr:NAD-dependent deacetylase [Atribacterota bacterium]